MPIRSHCGYYDFGKLRNLIKTVAKSREGQPADVFTVMEWTLCGGTGLSPMPRCTFKNGEIMCMCFKSFK